MPVVAGSPGRSPSTEPDGAQASEIFFPENRKFPPATAASKTTKTSILAVWIGPECCLARVETRRDSGGNALTRITLGK